MKNILIITLFSILVAACNTRHDNSLQLQLDFGQYSNREISLIAIDRNEQTVIDTAIIDGEGRVTFNGIFNGPQLYQIISDSLAYIIFLDQAKSAIQFDTMLKIKTVINAPSTIQMLNFHKLYKAYLSQALPLQQKLDSVMYLSQTDSIKRSINHQLNIVKNQLYDSVSSYIKNTNYIQLKLYYVDFLKHVDEDQYLAMTSKIQEEYKHDPYFKTITDTITSDKVYGSLNGIKLSLINDEVVDFTNVNETLIIVTVWASWDEKSLEWAQQINKLSELNTLSKPIKFINLSIDQNKEVASQFYQNKKLIGSLSVSSLQWETPLLKQFNIKKIPVSIFTNHKKEVIYIGKDVQQLKSLIVNSSVPITLIDSTSNM